MSVTRYPAYKDSGVAWLGEVPGHWSLSRHKYVASFNKGKNPTELFEECLEGMLPYLSMENLRGGQESSFALPQPNSVISYDRQVLILWDGSNAGEFVLGKAGIVSSTMAAAQIKGSFDQDYYWFYCQSIETEMRNHARGMGIPHVNGDELNRIEVPVPPIEEQQVIAAFLDRETGKIDSLVAEQEKLIDLLKEKRQAVISHAVTKGLNPAARMKDSGIEWLGKVPEHWQVFRLGSLFREVADEGQEDRPILSVSIHDGVSDRELDENEMDRKVTRSEDRGKYKSVEPRDLVYNMMRAWQGGFGTVKVPGMVSPAYVVARPRYSFSTAFIEQQLRSPQAVEEMRRHSRGVTDFRLRLYWDEFKSISAVMAPSDEQNAIAAFLDTETEKFDALTAEANRAIELLQERRSVLISAAVTGKIDVRGLAPFPDHEEREAAEAA